MNSSPVNSSPVNSTGLEFTGPNLNCAQRPLWKVGEGTQPAPPLRGPLAKAVTGADGRIWLVQEGEMRVSADDGQTWRTVPSPPGEAWEQRPRLSPDGREAWLEGNGSLLRLDEAAGRWVPVPGYPADLVARNGWRRLTGWQPLGGGLILLSYNGMLAYLEDGTLTPVPSVPGGEITLLADGTVMLWSREPNPWYMAVGEGTRREWIALPGPS